jgi:hypothetical protein
MKLKLVLFLSIAILSFSFVGVIKAQPSEVTIDEIPAEIPTEIPDPTISGEEIQISEPQNMEKIKKDQFIKGSLVGGAFGVIVGGIFVWFFKESLF